ncbi:hypothetical protein SAMN05421810_102818 [Amycolatopsis arida]|uniref:Dehydratase n=1 Tax=Amycolatopsis arida TaxID=587909 RepID=A0A1I5QZY9_9PSEU|nr:hypothetical protein [Amycolatopsis arida]TDX99018.1 hypothetical protein CLV69_101819 [Amycolatopsis arida]SFP51667.1 hypothetical protein SAMN05421810_102818 [Amycolatopsis arida]
MTRRRRVGFVASAVAGLAAALVAAAGPASAAAPPLELTYTVAGTTHIAKTDSDVELGPGTFTAAVDVATGDLTGQLDLPKTTTTFKVLGFVEVTSDVEFVPAGPATGKIVSGKVNVETPLNVRLSNVRTLGLPFPPVGENCATGTPVRIALESGPDFNPLRGGKMSGTYEIPEFADCGLATPLINTLVPGPGNTLEIDLELQR